MKKVAILLADGFEEIEALTPKDVLNRAGIECKLISIKNDLFVTGANGVTVKADKLLESNDNLEDFEMVVLPGGMPGAKYLAEDEHVLSILRKFNENKKYIAAICASPALVLSRAGVTEGKKVTSYPGMENHLSNAIYVDEMVVQDENIITSRGPATALEFSYKIAEALGGNAEGLKAGMLYKYLAQKLTN
ncbi:MAG: DJ-1/PfpI family protein [Clostridia bacterium]|nr:DJ-1/PfpI family protein [Clostridia bacterium]